MNKIRVIANVSLIVLCAGLLSTKSFAEPVNLHAVKKELKSYHDSGNYLKEITKVANEADKYITQQANLNKKSQRPKKLGIVLDVDETSLSYYKHLIKHHYCYDPIASRDEILTANAPPIKPILTLYQNAIKNNVAVFFVTARKSYAQQATMRNLKVAGYNKWTGLYTRPSSYKKGSIQAFKAQTRAMLEEKGYTIIASIGDQDSDLNGGHAKRTFKLPNPYYHIS
ncbi:MAG: HAD family acid phosphatase [Legionellaceae bacterium]|nr:HAD family acid phosphatase [Legionellaceae bacterium]